FSCDRHISASRLRKTRKKRTAISPSLLLGSIKRVPLYSRESEAALTPSTPANSFCARPRMSDARSTARLSTPAACGCALVLGSSALISDETISLFYFNCKSLAAGSGGRCRHGVLQQHGHGH